MNNYWMRSIRLLLAGVICPLLAGGVVSWRAWAWGSDRAAFAENLRAVEGRIRRLDNIENGLRARVEFYDEVGVRFEKEFTLPASDEYRLRATGKMSLVYDQRDPKTASAGHVVSVNQERMMAAAALGGGLLLVLTGLGLLAWKGVQMVRLQHLFRNGQRARTEVRDSTLKPGKRYGRFTYAFRGPDGRWYEGRSPEMAEAELKAWPRGRAITVVYDARNPRRTEPDVFGVLGESV